ncbi:hypothetical protein AB0I68_13370 [Streptomyces sp. NPDC050448]|uniref:hypothetical protein n=1 Tax=Streptomyces sp. NPDC050448 TaxID=3155404 RepID=UPI003441E6AF
MVRANGKTEPRSSPFGWPTGLVLLAGRGGTGTDGWRTVLITERPSGTVCGGVRGLAADATPEEARRAAATMVEGLAREFHGQEVQVLWEPPGDAGSWTARVVLADAG